MKKVLVMVIILLLISQPVSAFSVKDMLKNFGDIFTSFMIIITGKAGAEFCSDGTLYNTCSITKPYFCSNGALKEKCSVCGCDSWYKCDFITDKCSVSSPQQCSDGTPYNTCSGSKPWYCNEGILTKNCNICGCDSGYICGSIGECIVSSQPADCVGGFPHNSCNPKLHFHSLWGGME